MSGASAVHRTPLRNSSRTNRPSPAGAGVRRPRLQFENQRRLRMKCARFLFVVLVVCLPIAQAQTPTRLSKEIVGPLAKLHGAQTGKTNSQASSVPRLLAAPALTTPSLT